MSVEAFDLEYYKVQWDFTKLESVFSLFVVKVFPWIKLLWT